MPDIVPASTAHDSSVNGGLPVPFGACPSNSRANRNSPTNSKRISRSHTATSGSLKRVVLTRLLGQSVTVQRTAEQSRPNNEAGDSRKCIAPTGLRTAVGWSRVVGEPKTTDEIHRTNDALRDTHRSL